MSARKPRGTGTLIGARGVEANAFILAQRGRGGTFICVIKAAGTCVARRAGASVTTSRRRAALSTVGTGTGQTAVFMLTPWSCPSSGTLALVLVEGQQGADALVGTGVVGVTSGVLGSLAVLAGEAERASAGGAAWYRYTS